MTAVKPTVLLVEDANPVEVSWKTTLENHGFPVIVATNRNQAVECVRQNPVIGLVLMDIDPGSELQDGTAAAERILKIRDIPIIFRSEHAEKEMVEKAHEISGYGFILKSAGEFAVLESINIAIELFETRSRLKEEYSERNSAEQAGQEQLADIRFLADTAVKFIDTELDHDIYNYIGECLHVLVPDAYVTVNSIDQEQGIVTTKALRGVGNMYRKLSSIMGVDPVGNSYRLNSSILELARGKLKEFSGGLYELSFGGIPKPVCSAIEKVFQIGTIYGIAYMIDKQIFATSTFLIKKGKNIQNSEMIEAFVRQASIALKRRKIEEDLKESRLELQNLLKEKELLLQETHHRIKNNMNMIHSLLSIQSRSAEDRKSHGILKDAAGRLQTMMLLYEQLYRSENYREVKVRDFIPPLVQRIKASFPFPPQMNCSVDVDDLAVKPEIMTSLGIIITELITNSIKHAFHETRDGSISLEVMKGNDSTLKLVYRDNGSGLPENEKENHRAGLGLKLVGALVRQLDGSMIMENRRGAKITITSRLD